MNRKDFLKFGSAFSAGMLINPAQLLAMQSHAHHEMGTAAAPLSSIQQKPLDYEKKGKWKEFELYIDIVTHELAPAMKVHTLAFNGQVPGPEIRVQEGDFVRVKFKNKTGLNHTIHWHGMHVPWRMDGVPFVTQLPVMPQQEFVYEFEAKPYGTHFYHCHWGTLLHMQSGMYGSLIVEQKDDPIKKRFPYDREYTLIYGAMDVNFMRNELNAMLKRMKERSYLMMQGRFDKERFDRFDSKKDLEEHIEKGYQPPYVVNRRTEAKLPEPNWFTVNGKSYPATPILNIKENENIRVRLINAGTLNHHLHLHGHDFWMVADDGLVLPQFWQRNTIPLSPGKTYDIIIEGKNRGIWTFHDHDTRRATNNGLYPGGTLMMMVYDDLPEAEREAVMMMGKMQHKVMLPQVLLDQ